MLGEQELVKVLASIKNVKIIHAIYVENQIALFMKEIQLIFVELVIILINLI